MEPQAQQSPMQEQIIQEQAVRGTAAEDAFGHGPQPPADSEQGSRHTEGADEQGSQHTPCADIGCTPPMTRERVPRYPMPDILSDRSPPPGPPPVPRATRTRRRQGKEILLPQITQLALEGQPGRAIAMKFGLPVRTVNCWPREIRSQWKAAAVQSRADLAALALARLNGIYCQAMEAWRNAQAEIEPPAKTEGLAAGDKGAMRGRGVPPRSDKRPDAASMSRKRSRRRQSSDALLGRAITAVRESLKFLEDSARATTGVPAAGAARPEQNRRWTEGLERMTNQELIALEASLKAQRDLLGVKREDEGKM